MLHFGIDLGGSLSQVCTRNELNEILGEFLAPTDELHVLLAQHPPSRVVLETCAEAFAVADRLVRGGHDVRVVPATLVRQLGVGARGIKTDVRDARVLSEVSTKIDLPSVHMPSQASRDARAMASLRDALVRSRTMLINTVRGWLRTKLLKLPRGSKCTFTVRVRRTVTEHVDVFPAAIDRQLVVVDVLNEQISAADLELAALAHTDATCRLLMTAPGVGPLTSIYFRTVLDEVERFEHASDVESYLGLTPGEHSSSLRKSRTSITKAGASSVRRVLVQASWVVWMKKPKDPLALWGRQVAMRRGPKVAVVGMARKLAGILYAMWRDGNPYDPKLVSSLVNGVVAKDER
jgi:transposase